MINEDFVSFETAKRLKEAGFDYPCSYYYTSYDGLKGNIQESCNGDGNFNAIITDLCAIKCSAPTLYHAQKWLREVKGIAVNVIAHDGGKYDYDIVFLPNSADYGGLLNRSPWCMTYEEALSEGIDEALNLIIKRKE